MFLLWTLPLPLSCTYPFSPLLLAWWCGLSLASIQVRQFSSFTLPVEFCSHFANKFHLEFVNKFHLVDRNKNLNSWSAAQQQSKVAIQTCILCHHSSACFMINWWIFWYQTGYEMMQQSRILVDRHFCWILQPVLRCLGREYCILMEIFSSNYCPMLAQWIQRLVYLD